MFNRAISSSEILIPFGYELTLRSAWIVKPLLVWVLAIRLTITSRVSNGRPRQLAVMWQNMQCSILFHISGARRKVAHRNVQAGLIRELLQLVFPQPRPVAVAA